MWIKKYFEFRLNIYLIRKVNFNSNPCQRLLKHFKLTFEKKIITKDYHKLFYTNATKGNYNIELFVNHQKEPIVIFGSFCKEKTTGSSYFIKDDLQWTYN